MSSRFFIHVVSAILLKISWAGLNGFLYPINYHQLHGINTKFKYMRLIGALYQDKVTTLGFETSSSHCVATIFHRLHPNISISFIFKWAPFVALTNRFHINDFIYYGYSLLILNFNNY
jgi:hypothetical protein